MLVARGGRRRVGRSRRQFVAPGRRRRSTAPAPVHELAPGVAERVAATETPTGCSPSCASPAADAGVLDRRRLRRRRRPARRSRQPRHDPALGRGGRRRRRRAHARARSTPFNPKVVRASAGALFHVPVVAADARRRARGRAAARRHVVAPRDAAHRRRLDRPARASSSATRPTACADDAPVDEWVRIEHRGRAESLNVAMATTRARASKPPAQRGRLTVRPSSSRVMHVAISVPRVIPGDGDRSSTRRYLSPPGVPSRSSTVKGLPLIDDIRAATRRGARTHRRRDHARRGRRARRRSCSASAATSPS